MPMSEFSNIGHEKQQKNLKSNQQRLLMAPQASVLSIDIIDDLAENYNRAPTGHLNESNLISIELFMEYFVSRYYYGKYRYIVFEHFSTLSFNAFMYNSLLHVVTEFCQSIIRFSQTYFVITSHKIFDTLVYDNCLLNWLFRKDFLI